MSEPEAPKVRPRPRLFVLPPNILERIERSAKTPERGGWQQLCADILDNEVDNSAALSKLFTLEGVAAAIEALESLHAAMEAE
jgi:hypothetical protein